MSYDLLELSPSSQPSNVEWKEIATKAALTAGIAGAASMLLVGGDGNVDFMGIPMPQWAGIGLACGSGSVAADLTHKYVLPHIPESQKFGDATAAALSIGSSSLAAYIVMNSMGNIQPITPVILGGGSYVAAEYAYRNFVNTSTGGLIF